MTSINFILGVHNHQPVGNFDWVFEEAYQKAYLPFLETLEKHPQIRLMYHTTGPLLDWLEGEHPDFIGRIQELAVKGQIEIMTGGYYEPILAVLPDRDKTGQIAMMTDYIQDRFKSDARGLWLAERVWEPHLAKPLAENGVDHITLDDYHFLSAGLQQEDLLGYFRTDEQGYPLAVFPINMRLRYLIPFSEPGEAVDYLRSRSDETGDNLLVMCDDGEKFGLWPGTHEWVHKKGWLNRFFTQLEVAMNEGWLSMTTCSEYRSSHPPAAKVYLPCASYFEMSEWSLPAATGARFGEHVHRFEAEGTLEELRPFFKGGFWRNFIAKYPESNRMYRKALWVSEKVANIEKTLTAKQAKRRKQLDEARQCLYRAQCNCAYWHGVFGGLYLPHLRHAVYQNLLEAEDLCNRIESEGKDFVDIDGADFDADGLPDINLRNGRIGLMIAPGRGGSIWEFDFIPARYNLLNTLHRQPEGYHKQVAQAGDTIKEGASIHDQVRTKEKGLEDLLVYDEHTRDALIDHFLSEDESPDTLRTGRYHELGGFVNQPYEAEIRATGEEQSITLIRTGSVVDNQVKVVKKVQLLLDQNGIRIAYSIQNTSDFPLNILFAPEFNFAMLSGEAADRYYQDDAGVDHEKLNTTGIQQAVRRFTLVNEADRFSVHLKFVEGTEVWRYPVETVSQSEKGFERVYQSSCVLPVFRLAIPAGGKFGTNFDLTIETLS
jgi:alpha-amylase